VEIVGDALKADAARVVRELRAKVAKWDLPIDLANACAADAA
jgi:hypothetical protein